MLWQRTSVPAATAARSRSPVARWQRLYFSLMMGACVPLPLPGGPMSTMFLVGGCSSRDFSLRSHSDADGTGLPPQHYRASYAGQALRQWRCALGQQIHGRYLGQVESRHGQVRRAACASRLPVCWATDCSEPRAVQTADSYRVCTAMAMMVGLAALSALLRPPVPRAAVFASASGGPTTSEVRRRLAEYGVSTAGVFERSELLRLLQTAEQAQPSGAPPPVASMDVQSVMAELEERGIDFDVLAPEPALFAALERARSSARGRERRQQSARQAAQQQPARAPRREAPTPPRPRPSPPPPASQPFTPTAAKPAEKPRRESRGASQYSDLSGLVGDAFGSAVEIVSGAAEKAAPIVGDAIEKVSPAAAAAATAGGKRSRGAIQAVRKRLKGVRLPPKPVLLLLCVCALRFGLTRTALAATSAKLTIDLGQEAIAAVGARLGRGGAKSDKPSAEGASQ